MALYGFATEEERALFLSLISVSGVGPKVSLAALSGGNVPELLRAIASGDAKRFQAVPGIGKRTAERIIVELREKVAGQLEEEVVTGATEAAGPRAEARDGLIGLGYTPQEVERMLDKADGRDRGGDGRLGASQRSRRRVVGNTPNRWRSSASR